MRGPGPPAPGPGSPRASRRPSRPACCTRGASRWAPNGSGPSDRVARVPELAGDSLDGHPIAMGPPNGGVVVHRKHFLGLRAGERSARGTFTLTKAATGGHFYALKLPLKGSFLAPGNGKGFPEGPVKPATVSGANPTVPSPVRPSSQRSFGQGSAGFQTRDHHHSPRSHKLAKTPWLRLPGKRCRHPGRRSRTRNPRGTPSTQYSSLASVMDAHLVPVKPPPVSGANPTVPSPVRPSSQEDLGYCPDIAERLHTDVQRPDIGASSQ